MKHKIAILLSCGILLIAAYYGYVKWQMPATEDNWQSLKVESKPLTVSLPATGSIEPETTVQLFAPTQGRIDKILVKEGEHVQKGAVVAWMSSMDRVALLDMASVSGMKKDWENEILPMPIVAPFSGMVLSLSAKAGQLLSQQAEILSIGSKLIVRVDVDEADIAKLKVGQTAKLTADAIPDQKIEATVSHIASQSKVNRGLSVYSVELKPKQLLNNPYKSGMTVNVSFVLEEFQNVAVLPAWVAQGKENESVEVHIKENNKVRTKMISLGNSDGKYVRILEGLQPLQEVLVPAKGFQFEEGSGLKFLQAE